MQAPFIEGPPAPSAPPAVEPALACTTNELLGFRVLRPLGIVRGITVRCRNVAVNFGAELKSLAGGEISSFTKLCESARQEAFQRMLEEVAKRGGNGVIAVRYGSNSIAPGITEVIAYGMAVTDGSVPSTESGSTEGLGDAFVCTSNELPGFTVHHSLGVVQGLTVRTRNAVAMVGAGLKSLVGGEVKTITKMCEDARQQAYARMAAAAVERGADGIVAMRYDTNEVAEGITEVLAYGTAVSSAVERPSNIAAASEGFPKEMITTSSTLPGFTAERCLGVVRGISVRSSSLPRAIGAGFKSLVGGEIRTWTQLCEQSRAKAFEAMVEEAQQRGALGIVAMRYDCNQIIDGIVEVIAYGTAVADAGTNAPANVAGEEVPPAAVSTDLQIPGFQAQQALGVVRGISVQSVNLMRSIGAGFKSIVGGEIRNYTRMCEIAREEAFSRMLQQAALMGATGVTAMRYQANDPQPGVVEVICYGTAVLDSSTPALRTVEDGPLTSWSTSTTNELLGRDIRRSLGMARGVVVRSRNVFANIGAGLKAAFVGGEITTWTQLCESSRQQALERLLQHAAEIGGTGVTALRYETNEISPGLAEVIAYGTVVA